MATKVYLEVGSTKTFACAVDWPGWCRSGKGEHAALEVLGEYADRYRPVLDAAGVARPRGATTFDVVERLRGGGATDFGALSSPCALDDRPLTAADARRLAAIVEASWSLLDATAASAPATLRKGPRGGGRDRDAIVEHVAGAEEAYVRKVGLKLPHAAVEEVRAAFVEALTAARDPYPDPEAMGRAKPWPWRYAARRVAWHVLDHAWEIEDKSN
jgi:hypothetical protein